MTNKAKNAGFALAIAVVCTGNLAAAADKKKCLDSAPRGQELRDQGKLIDARDLFISCADPGCPPPVPTYCAEWLEDIKKKIPSVVIHITDSAGRDVSDAAVAIDGHPAAADRPIEVDPGTHAIHVTRAGAQAADETVALAIGERDRAVALKLADLPPPVVAKKEEPAFVSSVPLGSWIGWGVGAVGLIGFGIFGTKANTDFNNYALSCGHGCNDSARSDVERSMLIADIALGAAVVGVAVGTVLYIVRAKR